MKKRIVSFLIVMAMAAVAFAQYPGYGPGPRPRPMYGPAPQHEYRHHADMFSRGDGIMLRLEGLTDFNATLGVQLNRHAMIGLGVGYTLVTEPGYFVETPRGGYYTDDYYFESNPIFFNFRYYLGRGQWSPYFDLKLGCDAEIMDNTYLSVGAGYSVRKLDFGFSVDSYRWYGTMAAFRLAYNFSFGQW